MKLFRGKYKEDIMFTYGMRNRGFAPMCQPMHGFVERLDDPTGRYHDLLVYDRELSFKEMFEYELDFVERSAG